MRTMPEHTATAAAYHSCANAAWIGPLAPRRMPEDNTDNATHLQAMRPGLVDGLSGTSYHALCECDGRAVDPALAGLDDAL
jgi:hypothetical protein